MRARRIARCTRSRMSSGMCTTPDARSTVRVRARAWRSTAMACRIPRRWISPSVILPGGDQWQRRTSSIRMRILRRARGSRSPACQAGLIQAGRVEVFRKKPAHRVRPHITHHPCGTHTRFLMEQGVRGYRRHTTKGARHLSPHRRDRVGTLPILPRARLPAIRTRQRIRTPRVSFRVMRQPRAQSRRLWLNRLHPSSSRSRLIPQSERA